MSIDSTSFLLQSRLVWKGCYDLRWTQCRQEEGVGWYKLAGSGSPEGGPGPDYVAYVSLWYHCLSTVQINPFRPSPSHSATDSQPFRLILKIFSRSALDLGGGPKFFSHWGPNPLSAGLSEPDLEYLASLVPYFETEVSGLRLAALIVLPAEAVGRI
jgi:hypothetical protein